MSKRTQSIRSMFAAAPENVLSADNRPAAPRVTAGAVKSLRDTFSDVERDYAELREQLSIGSVAIEIDPLLVDPSPFADRFAEEDRVSFDTLKQSISEHGQEVPILVREHSSSPGRYQSAYGHRRVRALRELERPVKAYVRTLSDEDLVVAQGVENSAREDLTFIERAKFAVKLEEQGFERSLVQSALSIDRAEVSKLIAVAKAVPGDIVEAIGRAPKIGRGRWQFLADLAQNPQALVRMRQTIQIKDLKSRTSDERFALVLRSAKAEEGKNNASGDAQVVQTEEGLEIARLTRSAKQCRIQIDRGRDEAFADFVMDKLLDLYADYKNERSDGQ